MDINLFYGEFSTEALAAAVTDPTKVRSLDLSGNSISPEVSMGVVDEFICQMTNLESLDLKNNKIGPRGVEHLCNAIRKHCPKLYYLDLNENGILNESLFYIACLLQESRIKSLFLVANHLTPLGIATLCDGVLSSRYIRDLALGFNALGDAGASVIAKALMDHPSLRSLDISDNGIGDAGAVDIATYLIMSKKSHLESINLSVNQIGNIGFAAISDALSQTSNRNLISIDLGCNSNLGEAGRSALIKRIGYMKYLRSLDLCSSNLSDQDGKDLTEAVSRDSCGITTIEWYNNPAMKLETEKALFEALEMKKSVVSKEERRWHHMAIMARVLCTVAFVSGAVMMWRRTRY